MWDDFVVGAVVAVVVLVVVFDVLDEQTVSSPNITRFFSTPPEDLKIDGNLVFVLVAFPPLQKRLYPPAQSPSDKCRVKSAGLHLVDCHQHSLWHQQTDPGLKKQCDSFEESRAQTKSRYGNPQCTWTSNGQTCLDIRVFHNHKHNRNEDKTICWGDINSLQLPTITTSGLRPTSLTAALEPFTMRTLFFTFSPNIHATASMLKMYLVTQIKANQNEWGGMFRSYPSYLCLFLTIYLGPCYNFETSKLTLCLRFFFVLKFRHCDNLGHKHIFEKRSINDLVVRNIICGRKNKFILILINKFFSKI